MPIGVIVNVLAVAAGGVLGALLSSRIGEKEKTVLNMLFGLCAMAMGISSIVLMQNMPACVLSVIVGTCIGLLIQLQKVFTAGGRVMQKGISFFVKKEQGTMTEEEFSANLLTITVLFCFSGTGIYGSIVSGMGDHSILLAKSILDLFTALIFGCSMGMVVSVIAIPQLVIFMLLFGLAKVIYPLTQPYMINDFKAVGGILLVATGLRLLKLKDFPLADMVPAMVLAMPVSWLWVNVVIPLL